MKPIHYVIVVVLSFVSGVAGALICIEASTRVPVRTFDTIKAKEIQLIGSDGEQRLRMVMTEKGPAKGPGIYMHDPYGKAGIMIMASALGPQIRLESAPGKPSLSLGIGTEPSIILCDEAGHYSLTIEAMMSGSRIIMCDTAQNIRLLFGVKDGDPMINFCDAAENLRLAIGNDVTDEESGWGYRVFDSQENCVWRSGQ